MIKLLRANIFRLKKDFTFFCTIIATIIVALLLIATQLNNKFNYGEIVNIDNILFLSPIIIGILSAINTSLFIGLDYSDATIRNKITKGHKKADIYIANFLTSIIMNLIEIIIFMLIVSLFGIILLDGFALSINEIICILIDIVFIACSYSAIFTFIAMFINNATVSAIANVFLIFIMLVVSFILLEKLATPDTITQSVYNGNALVEEEIPNPNALTTKEKNTYQLIVNLFPTGQALQVSQIYKVDTNYEYYPLYSLVIIVAFTSLGICLFERKEIN